MLNILFLMFLLQFEYLYSVTTWRIYCFCYFFEPTLLKSPIILQLVQPFHLQLLIF